MLSLSESFSVSIVPLWLIQNDSIFVAFMSDRNKADRKKAQTSLPHRNDHEPDPELGRKIGAGKFRGFKFFCHNFSAKWDHSISCER